MSDNQPPDNLPAVGPALDTPLAPELDREYIKGEMARVVAEEMKRAGAENDYQEELVVEALLALQLQGRKLLFLRPEVYDIFRRQQQILAAAQSDRQVMPNGR